MIVGGGFAGIRCAKALASKYVDVTLIDARNFHLFQPLLYQVATGGLSPGDITAPLRSVLKKAKNVTTVLGTVTDIDVARRSVLLCTGARVPYDTLVVAAGASHAYFGNPTWEKVAPSLKTVEDATRIRSRVLRAFESAEVEEDPATRQALLTFVVVGGGPTGVELAGAIGELAHDTLRGEFRHIDPTRTRIVLVESAPHVLGTYAEPLAQHAHRALKRLGVEVLTGVRVVGIAPHGVDIDARGMRVRLDARTVLWAAGVAGSPLGQILHAQTQVNLDHAGRVVVNADCTVQGHPEIFVVGDLAHWAHGPDRKPLPGIAPVAMQMGIHAAEQILARCDRRHGHDPQHEGTGQQFRYRDKGTMAVIGRNHAVARVGFGLGWQLHGFPAWVAWMLVHVVYLVGHENRLLVLIQWANHYVTRNRGARLISGSGWESTCPSATSPQRDHRRSHSPGRLP